MFLLYYTKEQEKKWLMFVDEESIDEFIKKNDINDYGVTVNDIGYEKMKSKIEYQAEKIDSIKGTLKGIIDNY